MSIKLIAFDLDGTLLGSDGEVSAITCRVLHRAEQDGIRLVPATGRALPYFTKVRDALQLDRYPQNWVIALNGAELHAYAQGLTIRRHGISPALTDKVVALAGALDLEALCYTDDTRYRYQPPDFEPRRRAYLIKNNLNFEENIEHLMGSSILLDTPHYTAEAEVQKVAFLHSSKRLTELLPTIRAALDPSLCAMLVTPCWLEIMPRTTNKGAALREIMRRCDLLPEEVAAFGDGENDIEMLKSALHGYAMKNAFPSVLAAAPHLAPTNDENGVAKVVCSLCGYDYSAFCPR